MSRSRNAKFEWQDSFAKAGYRGATYAVGRYIGDRWNGDNKHPIVSTQTIAKAIGYGESAVEKALRRLRADGWLTQVRRGGRRGGEAWASVYRCTVPNPYSEEPNPYSCASQPVTEYGLVDQSLRPAVVDPPLSPGGNHNVACAIGLHPNGNDPDCAWCGAPV